MGDIKTIFFFFFQKWIRTGVVWLSITSSGTVQNCQLKSVPSNVLVITLTSACCPVDIWPTLTQQEADDSVNKTRLLTLPVKNVRVKVKVECSRYRTGMAQRVGRGITLLFHDRGIRMGWAVSSTPRPHFTTGKDPVPIVQEVGWAPGPVWTGGKSRPHLDSIPDRPAHSSVSIPTELPGPKGLRVFSFSRSI